MNRRVFSFVVAIVLLTLLSILPEARPTSPAGTRIERYTLVHCSCDKQVDVYEGDTGKAYCKCSSVTREWSKTFTIERRGSISVSDHAGSFDTHANAGATCSASDPCSYIVCVDACAYALTIRVYIKCCRAAATNRGGEKSETTGRALSKSLASSTYG